MATVVFRKQTRHGELIHVYPSLAIIYEGAKALEERTHDSKDDAPRNR